MKTLPVEMIAPRCSLAPVAHSREGLWLEIATAEGIAGDGWIVLVQMALPLKGNAPSDLLPDTATVTPTTVTRSAQGVHAIGPRTIASGGNSRAPFDRDERRTQRITQTLAQHMIVLGT